MFDFLQFQPMQFEQANFIFIQNKNIFEKYSFSSSFNRCNFFKILGIPPYPYKIINSSFQLTTAAGSNLAGSGGNFVGLLEKGGNLDLMDFFKIAMNLKLRQQFAEGFELDERQKNSLAELAR